MNTRKKSIFSNKTTLAPNKKRRKDPKDDAGDQIYKAKQAKILCTKPALPVSETNVKRFEISEDGDHTNYKEQKSQTKIKDNSKDMVKLNTNAYRIKEEMEEQVENTISDLGQSLHNDITTQFLFYQSNNAVNSTTESCDGDVQWEIIRVPYSKRNPTTNDSILENIPIKVQDKMDDCITPVVDSKKQNVRSWLENCNFATENRQRNFIPHNELQLTTPKPFTEYKMDDNKLKVNTMSKDISSPIRNQQENSYYDFQPDNSYLDKKSSTSNAKSCLDNGYFIEENRQQNAILQKGFHDTTPKSFTENKMGDNKLKADSITRDVMSGSSRHQDTSYFQTENVSQPFAPSFVSPESVSNSFRIPNSVINSQANENSDKFHKKHGECDIQPQQCSNAFQIILDENMDFEEMVTDSGESSSIFEETEDDGFHTALSTPKDNASEKFDSQMMFHNNSNHSQDNPTAINLYQETKATTNQSSMNKEKMTKVTNSSFAISNLKSCGKSNNDIISESANINNQIRINNGEMTHRCHSFYANSNVKSCGHSINDINLVVIKRNRKSKLKMETPNYSLVKGTNQKKSTSNLRPKTDLQNFIKNTMTLTHPEVCVNDDIKMRLEIFLRDILQRIGDEAGNLVTLSSKKLFDKRVLKYAIKLAFEKIQNEADVVSGKRNQWLF